ncbi:MAG: glycosyltransferase family 39 protein [bacterium]
MDRRVVLLLVLVAVFAACMFFWKLGTNAVSDTDEATHAMVTRSMVENGDVLSLRIMGENYFRKPPLAFWLRAGAVVVFGENEFALRLFSALAGVGTTLLLAWWAWLLTRKWFAPFFVGVVFPLLPITLIHTFRHGDTDGILIFLLTLTAFLLWRSLHRPLYLVWAAAILALAVMTKSAGAIVVPAAFAVALLITRAWPYRWKHVLSALGVFLAIAAPWHIYETLRFGGTFWGEYLGYHIISRVTSVIAVSSQTHGPLWYIHAAEKGMFPWSWLIVPATLFALFRFFRTKEERTTLAFFLSWGFGTILLYSFAETKLDWYIAPAYPAFLLLIVLMVAAWCSLPRWCVWITLGTLALLGARALYLFRTGVPNAFPFSAYGFRISVLLTGLLCGAIAVVLILLSRRMHLSFWRLCLLGAGAPLLIVSVQTWRGYLHAMPESPFRVFRNAIVAAQPHADVYLFPIGFYVRPITHWYLIGAQSERQLTPLKENLDALRATIQNDPGTYVIAEQTTAFPDDIAARLQFIVRKPTLALYRILSE